MLVHPRRQRTRRFARIAAAERVGEQIVRGETRDIATWKQLQSPPVRHRRFGDEAVSMERLPIDEPGSGVSWPCPDFVRQPAEQFPDLGLHVPALHDRGTGALPGSRERQEARAEREPEAGAREGCDHAPIVLPRGKQRQLFCA